MSTYRGDRTIDGVQVLVDGRALDPHTDLHAYSRNGFEWSYEGPEPRQLAFAILVDHLYDPERAQTLVEPFMRSIVANFGNEWEMTTADVGAALAVLQPAALGP